MSSLLDYKWDIYEINAIQLKLSLQRMYLEDKWSFIWVQYHFYEWHQVWCEPKRMKINENKWDKILLDDNKKHHPLCSSSFNHPLSHNHSTCKNIWPSGANPNWKNILVWFKSTILIRLDCFFVFDLDKMYFCRQGLFFYGV